LMQRLEADYKAVTDKEKEEVVKMGGLHVVGTERHVRSLFPSKVSGCHTMLLTVCMALILGGRAH